MLLLNHRLAQPALPLRAVVSPFFVVRFNQLRLTHSKPRCSTSVAACRLCYAERDCL